MKIGLFIVFLIYLQDVLSEKVSKDPSKILSHSYPKKVSRKSPQILISEKRFQPKKANIKKAKLIADGYTAFPVLGIENRKLYDIPDSPYFPVYPYNDQKRVKKILPDFVGSVRRKRSTDLKAEEKKTIKAVQKTEGKKVVKAPSTVKTKDQSKNKTTHLTKGKNPARPANKKPKKNKTKVAKGSKKSKKLNVQSTTPKHVLKAKVNNKPKTKLRKRPSVRSNATAKNKKRAAKTNTKGSKKKPSKRSRKGRPKVKAAPNKGNVSRRLIAARDALIEDYPYTVSIQKGGQHWCAGALLNPRLVITTANCVWKSNRVSRLKIRAGSRHADHGGQMARVQEVMKHPAWSIRSGPDNDVALLLLDRRIKFSDSVHGADLPNRIMLPAFEDAWVTSWGAERRDGVYDKSLSLQSYHARLMDRAKCNNITQRFGISVSHNFICLSQTGRRAPCTRDTGAPAVSDGVVWGLASWGIRKLCGTQRFPAMFSYLGSQTNMDFIMNATRLLMSDQRQYPFADRYPTYSGVPGQARPEESYRRRSHQLT